MIKLFRTIRQRLFDQNKTTTYLLYAMGEIILVVIGILLAIQLNNWNNKNTQQKQNIVLLQKLSEELKRDTARLGVLIKIDTIYLSLNTAIINCDHALALVYNNLNPQTVDSLLSLRTSAGGPIINTQTSIYQELLNTASLYSIGSDSLITTIKEYYATAEKEHIYNRVNWEDELHAFREASFLKNIAIDRDFDKNFNLQNYPWLFDRNSTEMKALIRSINTSKWSQYSNMIKMGLLKDKATHLLELIETEIN